MKYSFLSRWFVTAGVLAAAVPFSAGAAGSIPVHAGKVVLLDVAKIKAHLVTVGERGTVMLSEDNGGSWHPVPTPVNRTLTSVAFSSDSVGIAVGHGGTIIGTQDGGATWQQVDVADLVGTDSILGATALPDGRFLACGAFGMYLESADGGKSWTRHPILEEDFDRHISQVAKVREGLLLVGESGTLAFSVDEGATWSRLISPYEGSFFGAEQMTDGAWVIYGMRGRVFRSTDRGASWHQAKFDSTLTLNGGSMGSDGQLILAANRGALAISDDQGRSFRLVQEPTADDLSSVVQADDGSLVYVGVLTAGRVGAATLSD